jgi:hypothetical protein
MSTVTITINGREAIPVRAIPLMTNWNLNAQQLAEALNFDDLFFREKKETQPLSSYHLPDGVNPSRVLPAFWSRIRTLIDNLELQLDAEVEETQKDNYQAWVDESILLLPPGVFVWRDEFEAAFATVSHPEVLSFADEVEGDRCLDYQPVISNPRVRLGIKEGFAGEQLSPPPLQSKPVALQHEEFVLGMIQVLGFDPATVLTGNGSAGGKKGCRGQVKDACITEKPQWATGKVFDKTWAALREKHKQ